MTLLFPNAKHTRAPARGAAPREGGGGAAAVVPCRDGVVEKWERDAASAAE